MIYIVGNWKMHKTSVEALDFTKKISSLLQIANIDKVRVGIAPPSIHLPNLFVTKSNFDLVAQNIASEDLGAYTGEIAASMVKEYVSYVIVGHSERRLYFNETDKDLCKKVLLAFQHQLTPIFCFGEKKSDRDLGSYLSIIKQQLDSVIIHLSNDQISNLILAYEPIWAIGTGENASPTQIAEVHSFVREILVAKIGVQKAVDVPVLYGGSCNHENAESILAQPDVNGLLVGGASLDVNHFHRIIQISHRLS